MKIFFDLDGTLIDSKQRLYELFQSLVPQSTFNFKEYWDLKQNKISHKSILKNYFGFDQNKIYLFDQEWMSKIESDEYLKFDKPFEGVTEFLLSLKKRDIELYIITARQLKNKLLSQLDLFGWLKIFNDILVTEHKVNKEDLIKPLLNDDLNNWIIGDTGQDIQVGKKLYFKTAAVLSGFLNRKSLLPYHPDKIVNKITDLNF